MNNGPMHYSLMHHISYNRYELPVSQVAGVTKVATRCSVSVRRPPYTAYQRVLEVFDIIYQVDGGPVWVRSAAALPTYHDDMARLGINLDEKVKEAWRVKELGVPIGTDVSKLSCRMIFTRLGGTKQSFKGGLDILHNYVVPYFWAADVTINDHPIVSFTNRWSQHLREIDLAS